MPATSSLVRMGAAIASLVFLNGCASMTHDAPAPVQLGEAQYQNRTIPVFDVATVRHDARRMAMASDQPPSHLLVVIGERGQPVELGLIDGQNPDQLAFGQTVVAGWHFYPIKDAAGKPIVYAVVVPLGEPGRQYFAGPRYDHPPLNISPTGPAATGVPWNHPYPVRTF